MLEVSVLGSCAFVATLLITRALIQFSNKMGMIDTPNIRSSHELPTPKGGGLAFFTVFTLITVWFHFFYPNYRPIVTPLLYGGPCVVILGWLDDRYSLPALLRLLVHFVVAFLIYALVTQWFKIDLDISFLPDLLWVNALFCVLFIAWFINLYNFMDGADGLSSSTAIAASILMAVVSIIHNAPEIAMVYCLIAYTVSGFLFYNWSPARIFMGDTGSYFLGFLFASLALISKAYADVSFYSHIIIFGFFIFDATYVLCRRALRGEPIFRAHKMFVFHKLLEKGWSHRKISALYSMTVVLWLFPLSNLASIYDDYGMIIVVIAYLPLLMFAIYNKAGEP